MKKQKFSDVNALDVNVIIILILDSEETEVLDVNALDVNVIKIWILDSEETKVFGCNRTSCKH